MTTHLLDHEGLRLFSELLDIPSPSGHEDRMAAYLMTKLRSMGFQPESDTAGNVIVAAGTVDYRGVFLGNLDFLGRTKLFHGGFFQ